jgi:hypothetical protein
VRLVYDPRGLSGVTIVRSGVVGVLQMVSEPTFRFHGRVHVSCEGYGGVRVRDMGTYA